MPLNTSSRKRISINGTAQLTRTPTGTLHWIEIALNPWTFTGPMGYQNSEDEHEWPIHYPAEIVPTERYHIVLPLIDRAIDTEHVPTERLVETAGAFAQVNDSELLILE